MSVAIRCNKCKKFYAIKHSACPACKDSNYEKSYYVRLGRIATYAGNSLKIAREMDADLKKQSRLGELPAYAKPKVISFGVFIEKYYEPHFWSKNKSAEKMKFAVNFFYKAFRDMSLKAITPADIERTVTAKTVGRSPRTRDHYLAIIRRIFNYAVELELIDKSPVKMKELKVDNTRHRFLSDEEAIRLLQECKNTTSKHLYPMVMIALHTGMRLGEIQSLQREDIVDGKFYIKSTHTKNSRVKIIPINSSLQKFLDEYFKKNDEFKFNRQCRGAFSEAVKRAGIKDFRFHDLRHTFASKLKAQNINDGIIQQLMGLETASMVQRYAHLSPESVLNAIKVVDYGENRNDEE